MVSIDIPALWLWIGAAIWTVAAIAFAVRGGWLSMPERSDPFPFSVRQFFLMLIGLFFAFAGYIGSFVIAHVLTGSFHTLPGFDALGRLTQAEWLSVEHIIGLILGTILVTIVRRLLPADLLSFVQGKSQDWKKCVKGALYGLLFVPVILLATSVIGFVISVISPESRAPQVALEVLANIGSLSPLFWLMIGCIVVLVPYVEETLFRGFLQAFFQGLIHPALSVLLTSAAFALFHYSPLQKSSNFEIMVGLFVFSIFASKIREKEGALNACIGMHAAFNAASLFLFFGLERM